MTVEHVRVGDVLKLQRRSVVVDLSRAYEEIGIRSFGRGIFHKEPVSGADLGTKRVFRVEPGDLVISNVFAWEGAIAVASEGEDGRIGSHRFMTFVPTDDRIDTPWAAWYFGSEQGLELIRKASPGSAGRNRTLAINRFEALEIPLPAIDEQHRVANRLDNLSAAVSELSNRSDRASELTKAFVVSASSRPDLDDRAKVKAGWRRIALGEVLEPAVRQVQVEATERYRIAGIYSFGRGLIKGKEITGAETAYKTFTVLRQGDVVISKLGGWEGAVAVVGAGFEGYCVSSEYPTFVIRDGECLPGFLSGIARSPWFWETINSNTRGSMARRKRISPSEFLGVQVWLPPMKTQERVVGWFDSVDQVTQLYSTSRGLAEAIVPAAMNQAFAGLS